MTAAVGRFASGRPKLALLVWLAVIVPLSVAGIGVQSRLHDSGLSIDSSPSGKTTIATAKAFEPRSQALVVMHGPRPELERQRDALASRLRRERIALIGPLMTRGRDTELLVGEMRGPYSQIIDAEMPRLRAIAKASVRPPVSVYLGGYPDNGMAMVKGANEDIRRFELIAAPLLIVILLLIFRTPLAAAMPLAIGLTAIGATGGLLRLINGVKDLDVFAFSIGSMMALALGVDYALLLVSRFREERARGLAPPAAAAGAAATAGETVLTVGVILLAAAAALVVLTPGGVLSSAAVGLGSATLFSIFGGILALPALLSLTGTHVDALALGRPPAPPGTGRFAVFAARRAARPPAAGAVTLVVLAPLVVAGILVPTGPPNYFEIPKATPQHRDQTQIRRLMGPDFEQPFQILVTVPRGSITAPRPLGALTGWQQRFAQRSDVMAIFGPGPLGERVALMTGAAARLRTARRELTITVSAQRQLAAALRRPGAQALREAGLAGAAIGARAGRSQAAARSALGAIDRLGTAAGTAPPEPAARALLAGIVEARAAARRLVRDAGSVSGSAARLQRQAVRLAAAHGNAAADRAPLVETAREIGRTTARTLAATATLNRRLGPHGDLGRATRSGLLVPAMIATTSIGEREAAGSIINLERGSNAALITVFGKGRTIRWGHPLRAELERQAALLGPAAGGSAQVGGSAAVVQDYEHLAGRALPPVAVALSLLSLLALAAFLRSFWHALVAVALNLVTTGATFGLLQIAYGGEDPPLGGGGYVDIIPVIAIFAIVFALSIDYTLFLLTRMHEHFRSHGDPSAAIADGLRTTAGVVTGAATVMIGVFLAFASSRQVNLQQMGLGLAFAVLLDATLVRLVLLPAALRLLGHRGWPGGVRRERPATSGEAG